ncbi:MAG TPA: hypothetical protein VNL18_14275 [Gemmatimonadales bacterium]|nr:hypothetical protein [Gemmatimonadales bacterium]
MKRSGWLTTGLLAGAALACGDTTGVSTDSLVGTWNATKFEFSNPANSAQKADLVALGGSFTLTIAASGSYTATFQEPGGAAETVTGTISVQGDTLTVSESGQGSPTRFRASRSGNTLTLDSSDEEFDFDDNGTEEPARLVIVLVKQ